MGRPYVKRNTAPVEMQAAVETAPNTPTAEAEYAAELRAAKAPNSVARSAPSAPVTVPQDQSAADQEYRKELRKAKMEQAQELRDAADFASGKRGALPATRAVTRFAIDDPTIPRDKNGKDIRDPRYRYKYVPETDRHGNEGKSVMVNTHQAQGYEIVNDPDNDAEPYRTPYGILMRTTPKQAVVREMAFSPTGAVSPGDYFAAEAASVARQQNRAHREEVIHMGRSSRYNDYERVSDSLDD